MILRKDDIMEKKTHYFYALKLPHEVKLQLEKICNQLQFPFDRWVHQEDYHITLAFLGYANKEQLHASLHFVREMLVESHSFPLTIDHLGVFGKKDSPRIFWAGTEPEERLSKLRKLVYDACHKAEFQLETRPFHPHITLARKWTGDIPFSDSILTQKNPFVQDTINFQANEVVLYKTNLVKVPKYEVVESFRLI